MLTSPGTPKASPLVRGWVEGTQGVESVVAADDGGFYDVLETGGVRTIERRDSSGKRLWKRGVDVGTHTRFLFMYGATTMSTGVGVVTITSRPLADQPMHKSVLVVQHIRRDGSRAWTREFPNSFPFMPTITAAADKIIIGVGGDKPRIEVMDASSGKSTKILLPRGTNPSYLVGRNDGSFGLLGLSKAPGKKTPVRSTFFTGNTADGIVSSTVLPGKASLVRGLVTRGDRFFILATIQSGLGLAHTEVEVWTQKGELEATHRLSGDGHIVAISLSAGREGMIAVTAARTKDFFRDRLFSHVLDTNGGELRRVELQCTEFAMISKEQMVGNCYREDRSALLLLKPPR
jgi:hypothetical protein